MYLAASFKVSWSPLCIRQELGCKYSLETQLLNWGTKAKAIILESDLTITYRTCFCSCAFLKAARGILKKKNPLDFLSWNLTPPSSCLPFIVIDSIFLISHGHLSYVVFSLWCWQNPQAVLTPQWEKKKERRRKQERKHLAGTQQPFTSCICYQFPTFRKWFTSELCICESVFMWCNRVNALMVLSCMRLFDKHCGRRFLTSEHSLMFILRQQLKGFMGLQFLFCIRQIFSRIKAGKAHQS